MKASRWALALGLGLVACMGWSRPEDSSSVIGGVKFVYRVQRNGVVLRAVKQADDLPLGRQPLVIPAAIEGKTVVALNDFILKGSAISSLVLPDTISAVPSSACADCRNLERVVIGAQVKSLGREAFDRCARLKAVEFASSSQLSTIGFSAFGNCRALESIVLPSQVKKIDNSVFQSCDQLKRVTLPEGLLSIGNWAFSGCTALHAIRLPETLTSLGDGVFKGSGLGQFVVPDNVKSIGSQLCAHCKQLSSVKFGANVKSIKREAFWGCSSLTNFALPEDSILERIQFGAFADCSALRAFSFPASLKVVEKGAFKNTAIQVPTQFVK